MDAVCTFRLDRPREMIEIVFTLDYEIYGNGSGSLKDAVYDPMEKIREIFKKWKASCVVFVEAAELEVIESAGSDPYIERVKEQVQQLYSDGYEIGLHLHPQWYNGHHINGQWFLDENEYNLCTLKKDRINQIIDRSIAYLKQMVGSESFKPISFRAGNWLFQPTEAVAAILADHGIQVDSSVFKGGLQHRYRLDYRSANANGPYWRFTRDVNIPESEGKLLELPIYTEMVPVWKMMTKKRVALQYKGSVGGMKNLRILDRMRDSMRLYYPLKLDFCRMTYGEIRGVLERSIKGDGEARRANIPIVAIGHTKDMIDGEILDASLGYLKENGIPVSRLEDIYNRCSI